MTFFATFDLTAIEPEIGAPAPEKLISGTPVTTTWNIEEADGGVHSGVWQATPGKWRISYDEWEYFHIQSGHSIVTADDGQVFDLKAGASLILRPGFKGTWEVIETTRKDYVIRV